jgi:Zn-dependent protease with chaperone function
MPSETTVHYGRLSDGKSAASRDCQVRLDLTALSINSDDGAVRTRWPYNTLRSGEPIRPQSIDVIVSTSQSPGLTLFVPGSGFAAALAQRAAHLSASSQRWRHARPWIFAAAAIVGLTVLVHAAGWTPMRTIARMLPESWRDRLGDSALQSMSEDRNRCTAPSGKAALDKLIGRLSQAAGPGQSFRVVVVDWELLNAFAVPGNKILLTKELVEKADSPEEVAGVLAHEMGHGIALHPETGIIRAVGLAAALELMMGGSSGTLANMGLLLAQLGYTRAAEREADETALKLLREAGISQQGLGGFFRRMLKEEGAYDNDKVAKDEAKDGEANQSKRFAQALDMLSTHPPTRERAEMIRNSPVYPVTPALTPSEWAALRSICTLTEPLMEPENGSL